MNVFIDQILPLYLFLIVPLFFLHFDFRYFHQIREPDGAGSQKHYPLTF